MGENLFAIIDSLPGGEAGIFMVVDPDSGYLKVPAIEYPAGCNTARGIWGCGLATGRPETRLRAVWMAMIHLTAF